MVSWIDDRTGRFGKRPYYREKDLDRECEVIVRRLLQDKLGRVRFPLTTDELFVLVEQNVSDLDVYADLTDDGFEVEGVTDFAVGKRPAIKVSKRSRPTTGARTATGRPLPMNSAMRSSMTKCSSCGLRPETFSMTGPLHASCVSGRRCSTLPRSIGWSGRHPMRAARS